MTEPCLKNKRKFFINPIIDWSDQDVWDYIHQNNIPYCSLYDEGYKRIGCIMCPMSGPQGMQRDIKRFPKFAKAYLRTFEKLVKLRPTWEFKTGKEIFDWWITCRAKDNETWLPFDN